MLIVNAKDSPTLVSYLNKVNIWRTKVICTSNKAYWDKRMVEDYFKMYISNGCQGVSKGRQLYTWCINALL